MSASLVGSEMCIRDSLLAPRRARWAGRVRPAFPLRLTGGGSLRPSRFWTVSYTHLTLPTICSV
eukprot:11667162-Alexandrium_andersonii.AAC.1